MVTSSTPSTRDSQTHTPSLVETDTENTYCHIPSSSLTTRTKSLLPLSLSLTHTHKYTLYPVNHPHPPCNQRLRIGRRERKQPCIHRLGTRRRKNSRNLEFAEEKTAAIQKYLRTISADKQKYHYCHPPSQDSFPSTLPSLHPPLPSTLLLAAQRGGKLSRVAGLCFLKFAQCDFRLCQSHTGQGSRAQGLTMNLISLWTNQHYVEWLRFSIAEQSGVVSFDSFFTFPISGAVPVLNLPVWYWLFTWPVLMLWCFFRIIPCH